MLSGTFITTKNATAVFHCLVSGNVVRNLAYQRNEILFQAVHSLLFHFFAPLHFFAGLMTFFLLFYLLLRGKLDISLEFAWKIGYLRT